MKQTDMQPSK